MLDKLQRRLGLRTDAVIFFTSAALTVLFVATTITLTDQVDSVFTAASDWILTNLGWFYILGVTTFVLFLIWIALSRYGHVRLGGQHARPEYSNGAWFAMLFAAGIGTILMFWGVAEPISHFADPPEQGVKPESNTAAERAMAFALYHFGLHTWAIFCLPALAFAYFVYQRGLPFRVSSILHPLLGDRISGPIGKTVDVTAVVGTLFGVSVSIGLGTLQINSGLNELFGVPENKLVQVLLIAGVTAIATASVVSGLDKGIKMLSNVNILMAVGLLVFVLVAGPTLFMAKGIVESTGTYLSSVVPLSFWNDTFADTGWQGSWTVFYWAWTITWSPFVGIFVARISKGRTIREFVVGVLGLPTAFTVIWFSIFGMGSFDIEMNGPGGLVKAVVDDGDVPGALFTFLGNYPAATFVSALSVLIVVIFFTTSADSASMVVDMLCERADEKRRTPTRQRVFWAVMQGVVGGTLLAATGKSGLDALQQVITVIGLPFFVIAFLVMFCLLRALKEDFPELSRAPYAGKPRTLEPNPEPNPEPGPAGAPAAAAEGSGQSAAAEQSAGPAKDPVG